jgi:radical SAM superfamily enzyme YgiQ (UPF0313 family)
MVYKKGPPYRVRPVDEICEDIREARRRYGDLIRTLFFPAGNTIAMSTQELSAICRYAGNQFPGLERITVYGSSKYIIKKGLDDLKKIRESGLSRIHAGLESGDDEILKRVKKGADASEQIRAGIWAREAGFELSEYVILGLGGLERSREHALATAKVINEIGPHYVRLRTLVPKINTLLLHQIERGHFQLLSPHQVLKETYDLIKYITRHTLLTSDHYTNYINLEGRLPEDRERLLSEIETALMRDEDQFRPLLIGRE